MKKLIKDKRILIVWTITLGIILLGVFVYRNCLARLGESFRDFGISFFYCINNLFQFRLDVHPTVNDFSRWSLYPETFAKIEILPYTIEEFQGRLQNYWSNFFSWEVFESYLFLFSDILYYLSQIMLILLPLILLFRLYLFFYLRSSNNNYNVDSKRLKRFHKLSDKIFRPFFRKFLDLLRYIKSRKGYLILWILLFCGFFNFYSILLEVVSYYFYFVFSFDFVNLYTQALKLLEDLTPLIRSIPKFGWFTIIVSFMEFLARRKARHTLRSRESNNVEFINRRNIITIVSGCPGAGKTRMITDISLSNSARIRDDMFDVLLESDMKFIRFPWINFENVLKQAFKDHKIFNLFSARIFVNQLRSKFEDDPTRENLFDYDFKKYGTEYFNGILYEYIWDVLEDYACAYLIYIIQSTLILSNYSIRTDELLQDKGNFPLWDTDFFRFRPEIVEYASRHSKILDMDMFRVGKKMVENNPNAFAFGFGVYVFTEFDKERKNNLELQSAGIKASDDECNQKNDLTSTLLKMIRHPNIVANRVVVSFIADLQRPDSLGADCRELGDVAYISEKRPMLPCLPFWAPFWAFSLISNLIFHSFQRDYTKYRFNRGDNTVPIYVKKGVAGFFNHIVDRAYNQYGSGSLTVQFESGLKQDGVVEEKYFMQSAKINADRYATDCHRGFFETYSRFCEVGLDDMDEYSGKHTTDEELMKQHSFYQMDVHKCIAVMNT